MAIAVPTVLASTPQEYTEMLARAGSLSRRIHIDICDGRFADNETINIARVHPSGGHEIDLHLMVAEPSTVLHTALSIRPNLIIFHAESHGDLQSCMLHTSEMRVKTGIAVLPETSLLRRRDLIERADHVLIFTGSIGHNGGEFQSDQLRRVREIRAINHRAEISIDGGISDLNAGMAVEAGVDVLYVGSYIQHSPDPKAAYEKLIDQMRVHR